MIKTIKRLVKQMLRIAPRYTANVRKYRQYQIGRFTYGQPEIWHWGEGAKLSVGKYCSIAPDVKILLGGNHRVDWVTTYPFNVFTNKAKNINGHPHSNGDVIIGNDVWIGMGAMILSGVSVGDGAVIAARSVVTKDVPPYSIVGGNPARVIRLRFDQSVIDRLCKTVWWNWPAEKIEEAIPFLMQGDMEAFFAWSAENE
jgi:acetyltransferase-like isoleucine patch superfamily enzyme